MGINRIISLIKSYQVKDSNDWIVEVSKEIRKMHDREMEIEIENLQDEVSDLESDIERLENEISSMNYKYSALEKIRPSNLLEEQKVEILSTLINLSLNDLEEIQRATNNQ